MDAFYVSFKLERDSACQIDDGDVICFCHFLTLLLNLWKALISHALLDVRTGCPSNINQRNVVYKKWINILTVFCFLPTFSYWIWKTIMWITKLTQKIQVHANSTWNCCHLLFFIILKYSLNIQFPSRLKFCCTSPTFCIACLPLQGIKIDWYAFCCCCWWCINPI